MDGVDDVDSGKLSGAARCDCGGRFRHETRVSRAAFEQLRHGRTAVPVRCPKCGRLGWARNPGGASADGQMRFVSWRFTPVGIVRGLVERIAAALRGGKFATLDREWRLANADAPRHLRPAPPPAPPRHFYCRCAEAI